MNKLVAAKSGVVGMNAICSIALVIPFKEQWVLHCFKCWLLCVPSHSFVTTTEASIVVLHTRCHTCLPLVAAGWALPLSLEPTARKHLLRCFGVFVMVPVWYLTWCFGSKRDVLTYCFPVTIRAFGAACAAIHTCLPDMRASCRTVGAGPHDFQAAAWLHLDAAKLSIVVRMPVLLQLGLELTDVWQARLYKLDLLLLSMCCCGVAILSKSCRNTITFEGNSALSSTLPKCATSPTCLWLTGPLFLDAETAHTSLFSTRPQPNVMLPADPSAERDAERSVTLEVSLCICVHTLWEQKLPKLASLPAKLMIATLQYVMNRETGHGQAQTKLTAGRQILVSTAKRCKLTSEMPAL